MKSTIRHLLVILALGFGFSVIGAPVHASEYIDIEADTSSIVDNGQVIRSNGVNYYEGIKSDVGVNVFYPTISTVEAYPGHVSSFDFLMKPYLGSGTPGEKMLLNLVVGLEQQYPHWVNPQGALYGVQRTLGFSLYIPSDYAFANTNEMMFFEYYQSGSPTGDIMSMSIRPNTLQWMMNIRHANTTSLVIPGDILNKNQWYYFVVSTTPNYQVNGDVTVWQNGVQVLHNNTIPIGMDYTKPLYPGNTSKPVEFFNVCVGLYRGSSHTDTTDAYMDMLRWGDNYADVAAPIPNAVPVLPSAGPVTVTIGSPISYQIIATGSPASYAVSSLPAGLSLNSATGVISGTPTVAGTSDPVISASGAAGTGSTTLLIIVNPVPPVVTSTLTATGMVGSAFSYAITGSNSPNFFGATGLPAGLSVDSSTGLITGTPSVSGAGPVIISVMNASGANTATLSLSIAPASPLAPTITNATTASAVVGSDFSFAITATNSPTGFTARGLPAGITVDATTGVISGSATAAGTYRVAITAHNAHGTGVATMTISVALTNSTVPVFSSAITATGTVGSPFSYLITATNSPTSYSSDFLPDGLTLDSSTGAITGTPTAAATTQVLLAATNASGSGTATLTLTIAPITTVAPFVSNSNSAVAWVGTPFSFALTATNTPTSFTATGLPGGLTVNATSGVISGVPTASGTFPVAITASNASGTGTATLSITSIPVAHAPLITSIPTAPGWVGSAFSYSITASNAPISYATSNLPAGLSLNTATGAITGTPTTAGSSFVTLSVTNASGTSTALLNIIITTAIVSTPVVTSAANPLGTVGSPFSYRITASNAPNAFGASPLPAGLSLNATTGVISGTPTAPGSSEVTVVATNANSLASLTMTITVVSAGSPVISSAATASGTVGTAFTYAITASNAPTSYASTTLPAGLTLDTSTGAISGIPTASSTTSVTVSATNSSGTGTATVGITIAPAVSAPVITSAPTASGMVGSAFSYTITASNTPTSYASTILPTGLTLNTSSGAISGIPTTSGSASVTISATNAGGTGSRTVTMTILPAPPVISSAGTAAAMVGTAFTYTITASNTPTFFASVGLPAGLALDATTGVINGTPTASGTSSVTISATNAGGTGSATLSLTIAPASLIAPVISSAATASASVGVAFSYTIVASNTPTAYLASGLPTGTMVDSSSGVISGTPLASGSFTVALTAQNASGTGTGTLVITVAPAALNAPVISSAPTATGIVRTPFSYAIIASNAPTGFATNSLPDGLTLDATAGVISGIPTAPGATLVSLSASNLSGMGIATVNITIAPAPIQSGSAATASPAASGGGGGGCGLGAGVAGLMGLSFLMLRLRRFTS